MMKKMITSNIVNKSIKGGELEHKKHFSNEGELMQPPLK
jgi:hypothetical protein